MMDELTDSIHHLLGAAEVARGQRLPGEHGEEHLDLIEPTCVNWSMNGDDPAAYSLPEQRDLAAQFLLLYEMSLPFGQDLNNQINVDKSSTRFIVTLADVSSSQIRESAAAGEAWLESNGAAGVSSKSAGPILMFAHISERNIVGMLTGTAIALILVSLTLILAFQSLRYGLLSLVPNITPALLAFYLPAVRAAPAATFRCLAFLDSATGRLMVKTPFS